MSRDKEKELKEAAERHAKALASREAALQELVATYCHTLQSFAESSRSSFEQDQLVSYIESLPLRGAGLPKPKSECTGCPALHLCERVAVGS